VLRGRRVLGAIVEVDPAAVVAGGLGVLVAENLWGEPAFERLREALLKHPWRLKKKVTYLFNWIAGMLRELLHPHPKLSPDTG
jgi:hypothetical protein